jgi:hypothetical protein
LLHKSLLFAHHLNTLLQILLVRKTYTISVILMYLITVLRF